MGGNMAILVEELNKTTGIEIDDAELAQRVAILKRFKTLLTQQRDRFKNYLDLLDKQQNVIEGGTAEELLAYVEVEEKIVADIFSIQKVIDPLEEMYNSIVGKSTDKTIAKAEGSLDSSPDGGDEVPSLKASLEKLQSEAVVRSAKNKEMLSKRMLELRSEIKALRNNPYAAKGRSPYGSTNTASLIDIKG
jgi:CRISPR/Cas system CSM-associated protein Csm5 (group 7 of RAMP superfamily)